MTPDIGFAKEQGKTMKGLAILSGMFLLLMNSLAQAKEPPVQVVYRFDDHRYLELKGYDCKGELWYTDAQRSIHTQLYFQYYRIFTRQLIHPSERYIAVPSWEVTWFRVSRDYGQTWQVAGFSPGPNELNGMDRAPGEDALSFTVVNDQGFLQTKHSLYTSSKPFEDPRILPGGPGIPFVSEDGAKHILEAQYPGEAWGMVYMTNLGLEQNTAQFKINWQDLPDHVPEVKNYQGWDHMRCNMDAGKVANKL